MTLEYDHPKALELIHALCDRRDELKAFSDRWESELALIHAGKPRHEDYYTEETLSQLKNGTEMQIKILDSLLQSLHREISLPRPCDLNPRTVRRDAVALEASGNSQRRRG